jgi:hypothetical protein
MNWIACTDRMPEPGKEIWFHAIEDEDGPGGVLHGQWFPNNKFCPGFETHDSIISTERVTHWMPFEVPRKPDTF